MHPQRNRSALQNIITPYRQIHIDSEDREQLLLLLRVLQSGYPGRCNKIKRNAIRVTDPLILVANPGSIPDSEH